MKKYDGDNFTPIPRKQLRGQNTSLEIGLIELTDPSDTLKYKPFFKCCLLEAILHVFLLFMFVWNKIFCSKESGLYFARFWFGLG